MSIFAFLLILFGAAFAVAEDDVLTFHPAHWVESDEIEPTLYVSPLRALAFPSPNEGWMVGERYVLHVRDDRLEVAFVWLWNSLYRLAFSNPAEGWASGSHLEKSPIWRYQSGVWRRQPLPGIGWPDWGVGEVAAGPSGNAWAFASHREKDSGPRNQAMLRYDGSRWSVDEGLLTGRNKTHLSGACARPDGSWWFVGTDWAAPSGAAAVLAHWDGTALQAVPVPEGGPGRSHLGAIRCLPDGTAWALGAVKPGTDQPEEVLLLRYATAWERVPVPDFFPREAHAGALAPVSAGEVWLTANCGIREAECCERFLHYRDGTWETVGVPLMPGGRCTQVWVRDMQFVSPDEGWAVANDDQPRLGVGRIFHYTHGTWRLRNWNWHFWDAPWFNLFG